MSLTLTTNETSVIIVGIASHLLGNTGRISFPIFFRSEAYSGVSPEEVDGGDNPGGVEPRYTDQKSHAGGGD